MFKTSALLATAFFVLCDSAAIIEQVHNKCSIKDDPCLKSLYGDILKIVANDGIPELGVPITDPFIIKNMNVQPLGLVNYTLLDGTAKGFKNCYSTMFKNDIETGHNVIELICDIFTIEGSYIVESTPTFLALTGGINVHGKGKGILTIEKLKLNIDNVYEVKKHDDGELYFNLKPEESSYTMEVLGKATVAGDGVSVGNQDISSVAVNIANENWKIFAKNFGTILFDKALEIFYVNAQKFFEKVPVKDLITDDLSSYVK